MTTVSTVFTILAVMIGPAGRIAGWLDLERLAFISRRFRARMSPGRPLGRFRGRTCRTEARGIAAGPRRDGRRAAFPSPRSRAGPTEQGPSGWSAEAAREDSYR